MIAAFVAAATAVPLGFVIDAVSARLAVESHDDRAADERETAAPGDSEAKLQAAPPYFLDRGARWRRLAVVVASVTFAFLLGLQYGAGWELLVASAYVAVLLACTVTDLLVRRLPNVLVHPAIALAFVIGLTVPGADGLDVLAGGALSGGIFLAMALLPRGGRGDVKLGLFTGLALGLDLALPALVITTLVGSAVSAIILVATRLRTLHRPFPYGPYIALGAVVVMLLGGTAFVRV